MAQFEQHPKIFWMWAPPLKTGLCTLLPALLWTGTPVIWSKRLSLLATTRRLDSGKMWNLCRYWQLLLFPNVCGQLKLLSDSLMLPQELFFRKRRGTAENRQPGFRWSWVYSLEVLSIKMRHLLLQRWLPLLLEAGKTVMILTNSIGKKPSILCRESGCFFLPCHKSRCRATACHVRIPYRYLHGTQRYPMPQNLMWQKTGLDRCKKYIDMS